MLISIPGKLALRRIKRRSSESGLTLIEILVSLTIVGVAVGVAAMGLRSAFDVNLKKSASRLSSTLRYLSNKAVIDQVYLRMVYDLDAGSYRVEQANDPFVISPEKEKAEITEEGGTQEVGEKKVKEKQKEGEKASAFAQAESSLLKPTKLPSGVAFKDVSVSYLSQKAVGGAASTYFFPDGYATPTIINLRNKEDDIHFSIEVLALSGRVTVKDEYKESFTEEGKK